MKNPRRICSLIKKYLYLFTVSVHFPSFCMTNCKFFCWTVRESLTKFCFIAQHKNGLSGLRALRVTVKLINKSLSLSARQLTHFTVSTAVIVDERTLSACPL